VEQNKMRKIIIVLLLILLITTSAYAVNIFDRALYKKVLLACIHNYILVTRLTGEVKYVMGNNGKWALIPPAWKQQYQSMYNAQTGSK
jgi:hypothetical protein